MRGTLICGVNDNDDGRAALEMAVELSADLIVVGAWKRGRLRRGLESRLAEQLGSETPVPVLIAPPRRRGGKVAG